MVEKAKPPVTVGHPAIDSAHRNLVGIFDELERTLAANDRHAATLVGEKLFRTFENHFADEERLMAQARYDDERRKAHIRGHNAFTENLLTFMSTLPDSDSDEALTGLAKRLKEDFTDHHLRSDGELARFLARRSM